MKSKLELVNEIIDRIHEFGCRVTIPYCQPSPLVVLFGGTFDSAAYIPMHPATFYLMGMEGQISISDIMMFEQVSDDAYVITFGRDSQVSDMMIKILK